MSIYSRRGDSGKTSDIDGSTVLKDDPFIEARGTLDELISTLGWVAAACPPEHREIVTEWERSLFDLSMTIGGETDGGHIDNLVHALESKIDMLLPENLRTFIIPGGCEAAARVHMARTICRRAERRIVTCTGGNHPSLIYLNRLSDALFALAICLNREADIKEEPWQRT